MTAPRDAGPGFLLWHVTLRWQRDVTSALRPFALTHTQFVLLASTWWLNEHGRQPSQAELGEHSGVDVKMVSQVVRMLERKGLVQRRTDPGDTRALLIAVTDAGARLAPEAIEVVESVDRLLLEPLSQTAQRGFTRALDVLARPIDQ